MRNTKGHHATLFIFVSDGWGVVEEECCSHLVQHYWNVLKGSKIKTLSGQEAIGASCREEGLMLGSVKGFLLIGLQH